MFSIVTMYSLQFVNLKFKTYISKRSKAIGIFYLYKSTYNVIIIQRRISFFVLWSAHFWDVEQKGTNKGQKLQNLFKVGNKHNFKYDNYNLQLIHY